MVRRPPPGSKKERREVNVFAVGNVLLPHEFRVFRSNAVLVLSDVGQTAVEIPTEHVDEVFVRQAAKQSKAVLAQQEGAVMPHLCRSDFTVLTVGIDIVLERTAVFLIFLKGVQKSV
jgi:hypothetical protein